MARLPAVLSSAVTPASSRSRTYICSMMAASVKVGPPTVTVVVLPPLLALPPAPAVEVELDAASNALPPPPQAASANAVRAAPASRTGRPSTRNGEIDIERPYLLCPAAQACRACPVGRSHVRCARLVAGSDNWLPPHRLRRVRRTSGSGGRRPHRPLQQLEQTLHQQRQRGNQHGAGHQLGLVLPVEPLGDQPAESPAAGQRGDRGGGD